MSVFLTDNMALRRLDFEMLNIVVKVLFGRPDFITSRNMPRDVLMLRDGVFLIS